MKHRTLWIILGILVLAGILVFAVLGLQNGKDQDKAEPAVEAAEPTPEPTPVDPELPLDDTPLTETSPNHEQETEKPADGETPGGDTQDGQDSPEEPTESEEPSDDGPEEDELPIMP